MIEFLRDGKESPENIRKDIYENVKHFKLTEDDDLLREVTDDFALYIAQSFRADFLDHYHGDYGHLRTSGLLGVVANRGWWSSIEKNIRHYISACKECQCAQRAKSGQEREISRTLNSTSLQIFDR